MGTWLTERFGTQVPVVAAPMAGVSGGALAAAASAAGALGCIGIGGSTPVQWVVEQGRVAAAAGRPFGVGLLAWALEDRPELLEAALSTGPALVSISYGRYDKHLAAVRAGGAVVATQAGTVAEALAAERAGVDVVVARGGEGGGHGRDDVATLPLLQGVLDAVRTPVLAAGGIATGRGVAAVLAAGAAGAWVGTAFLTCREADNSPEARSRLVAADSTSTAYGRVFDVGLQQAWPAEYGGRALRNAFFERWRGREDELASDEPARSELRAAHDRRDFDIAVLYAGQAVGLVDAERAAADVVAELARGPQLLAQAARSVDGTAP